MFSESNTTVARTSQTVRTSQIARISQIARTSQEEGLAPAAGLIHEAAGAKPLFLTCSSYSFIVFLIALESQVSHTAVVQRQAVAAADLHPRQRQVRARL